MSATPASSSERPVTSAMAPAATDGMNSAATTTRSGKRPAIYFQNLDGLRFFAAFAVLIHHVEQVKGYFSMPSAWHDSPVVHVIGKLGVIFFFSLSGFLITYLLLVEESRGPISVGRFYMRRLLRIWPLYYWIVILSLGILPFIDFMAIPQFPRQQVFTDLGSKVAMYGTFLANLALAVHGVVPYVSQAWSIGTEEQFYLIWPVLVKFARHKAALMIGVIVVYLGLKLALRPPIVAASETQALALRFLGFFSIDCMAFGGLAAVALHQQHWTLKWILNLPVALGVTAVTATLIGFGVHFPVLHYEIYAVLFTLIILNFAALPALAGLLEARLFRKLGQVSYGIYMYHMIAIVIVLRVCQRLEWDAEWIANALSLLVAVALATISYRWLEEPFLRLKSRFTVVRSHATP